MEQFMIYNYKDEYKYLNIININNLNYYLKKYNNFYLTNSIEEKNKIKIIEKLLKYNKTFYVEVNNNNCINSNKKIIILNNKIYYKYDKLELNTIEKTVKRLFDILISLFGIIFSIPVILIASIFIKLDSKGPIFYTQERITINNKKFKIIKLRTMVDDAEKNGPLMSNKKDKRITKVGKFLRKYKIDELPQFINVLKGDMSIVGPRPERQYFINEIKQTIPNYDLRLKVKAGMTCIAHTYGNNKMGFDKRLQMDIIYMINYRLILDVKIILKTIEVIMKEYKNE